MAEEGTVDDGLCMGTYSSIYAVNAALPGGGQTGQYVMICGLAHYWNADRGTWCVNEQRDDYWDGVIQMMGDRMTTAENGLIEETKARKEGDEGLRTSMVTEVRKTVNKTVAQEIMNRKAAVAQEAVERKKADAALREAIDALEGGSGGSSAWEEKAQELTSSIAEERRLRQEGDDTLEAGLTAVSTTVTGVERRLTTAETTLRQTTAKVSALGTKVDDATATASGLEAKIAQETADRQKAVSAVSQRVTDAEGRVDSVEAKADAASEKAASAETKAGTALTKATEAASAAAQEAADRKAAVEAVEAKAEAAGTAAKAADEKAESAGTAAKAADAKAEAAGTAAKAASDAVAQEAEERKAEIKALKAKTVVLTEEEYAALETKDGDTFYYTYVSD